MKIIFNILIFILLSINTFSTGRKIVLATDPWEPYYGDNMPRQGYISEIAKEAFRRSGYEVEIVFIPWKRALEDSKRGKYDGILGGFYTKERTEYFFYSEPVSEVNINFFARKGSKIKYTKLKDLSGYKIGVTRGYKYSREFDNAEYIQKEEIISIEQNIKKLIHGRIDLFIASKEVVLWTLKSSLPDFKNDIELLEPSYITNDLYILISRKVQDSSALIYDFNKGFDSMVEDGTLDKIIEKNRIHFSE